MESATSIGSSLPDRSGFVPTKGGRIWYRLDGEEHLNTDALPLIIVHGGPGGSHHYLLPLRDLADERAVIFYDQLDCGQSDRPNDPANWIVGRFVEEVDDLAAALDLERFALLGHSWGGLIAAEYAARRGDRLAAVILACALISTPRWIADNTQHRRNLPTDAQEIMERHERAGTTDSSEYGEAIAVFMRRHFNRQPVQPPEIALTMQHFNPALYSAMWGNNESRSSGSLKGYDGTCHLPHISVPTLFICGEFDESTPEANRDFASLVPKAEVSVIADSSHTAHLERRAEFLAELRRFLSRR